MRTTIFTCSIYPDLTRVWHHFVKSYASSKNTQVLIYDCGSRLRAEHFSGAHIMRHCNVEHGKKIDHCIQHSVATPLLYLADDDTFLTSETAEPLAAETLLSDPRRFAFSFRPRGWWKLNLGGHKYPLMGSDALVFKPEIVRREGLSFSSRRTTDTAIRNGSGYYDTGDYAQEQLLRRGYEITFLEKDPAKPMVPAYTGVSCGFVNFAKRHWWHGSYSLSRSRAEWENTLRQKMNFLERACGVAATISLHRTLFDAVPQFADFFTFAELGDLAAAFADTTQRGEACHMVASYRKLLTFLEQAA